MSAYVVSVGGPGGLVLGDSSARFLDMANPPPRGHVGRCERPNIVPPGKRGWQGVSHDLHGKALWWRAKDLKEGDLGVNGSGIALSAAGG
jgi:hypothetical protein